MSDPTPQPAHDHGAAGFCTDHAQPPDERTETVARVLREHQRCRCCEGCQTCPSIDVPIDRHQAALVVAALDDETEALTEARDDWAKVAGERADQRDAARAALDRVRAAIPSRGAWLISADDLRAALDPEEPR